MKISKNGLELIKRFEGCRLTAYYCPAGVLTIGYGHTGSDVKPGMVITYAKADELLRNDVVKFEKAVMRYDSKYHWNQNQFDALVSFAFNIGSINQLTAYGIRSIAQISSKIPAYNKAGGKVLYGLVRRREEEKKLFDKPVAETQKNPTTSTTITASISKIPIKTGKKIKLKNVNLYASSTTKTSSGKRTGTYYVWSNEIISGRIRITNKKINVGKSGQVTGWINKKYAE